MKDEIKNERIRNIYDRYGTYMASIAYRLVKDSSVIQDIIHDTIIDLWEQYPKIRFDNEYNLRAYIGRIVQRKSIDYLRKKNRQVFSPILIEAEGLVPSEFRLIEELDSAEYYLSLIDEKSAELLRLRLLEEYSYHEIAMMLEISEAAARKRMERSIEKLRKAVEEVRISE